MKNIVFLLVVSVLFSQPVLASEYSAFTGDLVKPYGFFKQSLALTSKKEDIEKAKPAVAAFIEAWSAFSAKYAADAPKPFAQQPDFSSRIKRPVEVGKLAAEYLKNGEVKQAHMVLEEVRYLMWDLRVKSGIVSLSDKANDFHEAMEIVLDHADAAKGPTDAKQVFERYGAWFQIKWDDLANAPDIEPVITAFVPAFEDGRKAVAAYLNALKMGDVAQAKKLSGGVKGAYKKIWMLDNR